MQPLTATLPQYPTELRRQLQTAERRLELQNCYIAQSQIMIDLLQRLT